MRLGEGALAGTLRQARWGCGGIANEELRIEKEPVRSFLDEWRDGWVAGFREGGLREWQFQWWDDMRRLRRRVAAGRRAG